MGDDIREENIARNNAFLENLGLGNNSAIRISSHLRRNAASNSGQKAASNSGQKAASNSDVVETPPGGPRRSTRAKRIREGENHIEFKCKKCNVDKVFLTLHGLHLHQRRTCSASTNYKPKGFYGFTEEEYNQIFHLDTMTTKSSTIANEDRAISNTNQPMTIIEQDIFDVANECNTDEVSNQKITKDIALVEATTSETLISTFANLQNKLCSYLFGDKFITCKTYEEVINCIQCHYDTRNSNKVLHDANVYNFYLESGLSRKNGNKLLSVIRSFNPVFPVPRSINGIETRIKKSMKQHNNVIKLSIPWIDKWKMNELKGFQPIKIFVRNIFEVISHMLIDPEIMLLWRNHFKLKYFKATDQQGNHVYSDVMSSEWALHSELMVHEKDPNGHLMPLIFYTDGVQVSSNIHNKITPVIVTLGNFSDSLLQRDISKRVIAYLPNFKCYSKALMISHITSKCGISKTKVTSLYV